ncbi:NADH:flavin oxidoreductase [Desulfobacter hydrogenophilus]|uniref:FAD-dependent oxidoreductase n=1 Tax=Desulfobacter hydrogenophilus TaxID=2291 RepID=A0A328FJH3_9BACT|nr:FAD-dependent oxidoreductase [Desulfobacter hydrogenophilus]NDY73378.1 FAD-dependent oxidoreductase [Desulfobacter hydrogenophilus]QBH12966.1 FAD-dependent oxidoreductase [Desulfobacter hydrogenophilus]RAM03950.1 NADH:flavin oxidoreductase [Desulfobacter hydrogenophilus]
MTDPLFAPIRINQLNIPNRIYMPAMHLGMAQAFEVTDQIVEFYARRAKGGPGMICVGYATVDELSGNTRNIGAHDDKFIPGLTRLAETIRKNGSLCAVQINHAGRYNFSFLLNGKQPVAPSAIASRMTKETPKALEIKEIQQAIESFANAAARVKKAGFDAVEILSGTGYLISEFLSPLTNQRTDEYGGYLEKRMRFGLEVAQAVRDAVGPDYPLIVRMNGNDFMPGGNKRSDLIEYAKQLSNGPVDALCINVGWHEARVPQIVAQVPKGAFGYLARDIRAAVHVPVIASHRIDDPETAREMINQEFCDMVAMGRSLIADPDLPKKAREGREKEIVHCIACAQGCFDNLFKLKHVECLCNPLAGHEYCKKTGKVKAAKKVMVIGGGPAGMTAALACARRGHDVTLYESARRLGGQLHLAAAPPGRKTFSRFSDDLETQLSVEKIPVVLNCKVDEAFISKEKPDTLILATGAIPLKPAIPGMDLPHVAGAWDVLENKVGTGKNVAIIGGGAVGVETALVLSEKGTVSAETIKFLLVNKAETPEALFDMATRGSKKVCLIEMTNSIGRDIGKSTRWGMMQDLRRFNVETVTAAKVLRITETGLEIEKDGKINTLDFDTVVVAVGAVSYNPLEQVAKKLGIDYRVVGDALKVGTAFDAVHGGYEAAVSI